MRVTAKWRHFDPELGQNTSVRLKLRGKQYGSVQQGGICLCGSRETEGVLKNLPVSYNDILRSE